MTIIHNPEGFAPGVQRDHHGWVEWPRDTDVRREWFTPDAMAHPAKANIHMLMDLVRYYTEEGDTILDPFGGIGSLQMATLLGRNVILTEIDPTFHELQKQSWTALEYVASGRAVQFLGDCRLLLPLSCQHIITSPPYSNILAGMDTRLVAGTADLDSSRRQVMSGYGNRSAAGNLGTLNPFFYNQAMTKVYQLMVMSVQPGGVIITIIKDFIKDNQRQYLSTWCNKLFADMGVPLEAWIKRKTHTIASDVRISQGLEGIEDEDILVYRRP